MKDVSWICEGRYILRNITWDVNPGEHWAIVGLNGSGKTTLLNMINGYLWPTRGEISVLAKHFGRYDVRKVRKKIGWVSSSLQERLYIDETAEEIVLSGRFATIGLYDRPGKEDRKHARNLLEQLGCGPVSSHPYWTLSQGERQKVLIARALISSPRLLILDEPCAGLDIFSREQLLSSIDTIGAQSNAPTVLYVTHHVEELSPLFCHLMLLRRGEVYAAGRTREVLSTAMLSGFFETPVSVHWRRNRPWLEI